MELVNHLLIVGFWLCQVFPNVLIGHAVGHNLATTTNEIVGGVAHFVGHFHVRHIAVVEHNELHSHLSLLYGRSQRGDVGLKIMVASTEIACASPALTL